MCKRVLVRESVRMCVHSMKKYHTKDIRFLYAFFLLLNRHIQACLVLSNTQEVMAGSVVVLMLLSLGLAGTFDHASAQECDSNDAIVGHGSIGTVYKKEDIRDMRVTATVFVQTQSDFKGVSGEVTLDYHHVTYEAVAWFPNDQCFPRGFKWTQMDVVVEALTSQHKGFQYDLRFKLLIGNCTKTCTRTAHYTHIKSLTLVGYGSSSWRHTNPRPACISPRMFKVPPVIYDMPNCTHPPTPSVGPHISSAVVTVVAAVGVVVLVVVVLAAVVLVSRMQAPQPTVNR